MKMLSISLMPVSFCLIMGEERKVESEELGENQHEILRSSAASRQRTERPPLTPVHVTQHESTKRLLS